MSKRELPVRVQRIIDACRGGQTLVKSFRFKASGDAEMEFHFEPSGRGVGPQSALGAIQTGLLRPAGDRLFGTDSSQSWRA